MFIGTILPIAAGGAIGAVARFAVAQWLVRTSANGLPIGTLAVNIIGSFLIGLYLGYIMQDGHQASPAMQFFVVTGVLGGFTTFSTFSFETIQLLQRGEAATALSYIILSLIASLGACALAIWLVKAF